MAVTHVNIGDRRIHMTAYNPHDAKSLLFCEFVLGRVKELLDGVSEQEARDWLIAHVANEDERAGLRKLFEMLDGGFTLPRGAPYAVDPKDVRNELHIIEKLRTERRWMEK